METLATRGEKQFSSRMRFCKIDRENTEHGAKARGDGASTDSGIDRPRNVPSPPPLGEPHRITSPTPLRLTIRDTGTPASPGMLAATLPQNPRCVLGSKHDADWRRA